MAREARQVELSRTRASNGNEGMLAPYSASCLAPIPLTMAHFVDEYLKVRGLPFDEFNRLVDANSQGTWNLSAIKCPDSRKPGIFFPPLSYNEKSRDEAAEEYSKLKHWNDKEIFRTILGRYSRDFGVRGISVSLVVHSKVIFKHEMQLGFQEVPRGYLLDGHAILSKGPFTILDTQEDWRTVGNNFVRRAGIRFYCGVSIVAPNGYSVGALSIFDGKPRLAFGERHLQALEQLADSLMRCLEVPYDKILEERARKMMNRKNPVDLELAQLLLQLGRATTQSSSMMVYERDGSGSPYSQSLTYSAPDEDQSRDEYQLDAATSSAILCQITEAASLNLAAAILSRTVAAEVQCDLACVIEVRIAEIYILAETLFPRGESKISLQGFKHARRLRKVTATGNDATVVQNRILGMSHAGTQKVSIDKRYLVLAMSADHGVFYKNRRCNAVFKDGILMPFHRAPAKLVKRSTAPSKAGNIEVYKRTGGFMICVLNRSLLGKFDTRTVSRVFDHARLLRHAYLK